MNEKGHGPFFVAIAAGVLLTFVVVFLGLRLEGRLGSIESQVLERAPGAAPLEKLGEQPQQVAAGQTVYVPVYSHIYHDGGRELALETTLSIRNTDPAGSIVINSVRYYDTGGTMVRSYLEKPAILAPLASADFLVERRDTSGGSGANFLVEWVAEEPVNDPVIEAVMVGGEGTRTVSFVRAGQPVAKDRAGD